VRAVAALAAHGLLEENVCLAGMTNYRMGGPARYFLEANSEGDLKRLASALAEDPMPVVALGRGSDVVVSSAGFPGVVVRSGRGLGGLTWGDEGMAVAGASLALPALARRAAAAGRAGLEFMVGIPGSVGGAVCTNAGAHGTDTATWLVRARVIDLLSSTVTESVPRQLGMQYRQSGLAATDFVVEAVFRTVECPPHEAEARVGELVDWRRRHQPGGAFNAGSVFKNPPGDSAGRIIDSLGLKGFRVGGVTVSEVHANFFVAGPGALPEDVHALVEEVRRRVLEGVGINLDPEIRFIGQFPTSWQ
jgi:UDP-N-acetylmuramate dehydrogenase